MDATDGCTGFSFGGSNVTGWDRGSVEDVGGYEGGPRGAILVYTAKSQSADSGRRLIKSLTFGEKTTVSIHQVPSQVPSVAKVIVPFDQLDTVSFRQAQFI
jgi:hypothetical protein